MKNYWKRLPLFFLCFILMGSKGVSPKLKQAKIALLNGNIPRAEYYLTTPLPKKHPHRVTQDHYRSIASFLRQDYEKTLKNLKYYTNTSFYYSNICLLKVMSKFFLASKTTLKEIYFCRKATEDYSPTNSYWLDSIEKIILKKKKGFLGPLYSLGDIGQDPKLARIWLKANLHHNNLNFIVQTLPLFSSTFSPLL